MAKAELNFGELSGGSGTWAAPISWVSIGSQQTATVNIPSCKSIVIAVMGYSDVQQLVVLNGNGEIVACQVNGTDYTEPFNHNNMVMIPAYQNGVLSLTCNSGVTRNVRYIAEV